MNDKELPQYFRAEAMNTAVYMLNRVPSQALNGATAYELWFNKEPATRHLKIFGSLSYCHIAEDKRNKLDKKA